MRIATGFRVCLFLAGAAAVALLPFRISDFRASEFAKVAIYLIALLGLQMLTGYTGQISLGHGAFMAIGAYTTAILVAGGPAPDEPLDLWPEFLEGGVRDLWTIPLAGVVAGLAGALFGLPALRLRGLYLALATFAVAVATPAVLSKPDDLTGGSRGIQLFGLPELSGKGFDTIEILGREVTFYDFLYYLSWSIAGVLFVAAWLLLRGRAGRAFKAIRDSEVAAAASGVNLAAYKTLAFSLSAFYAGVAGALFAIFTTFVSPSSFPVTLSILLLIGVVVGGLGSLGGLVLGALFIQFLPVGIRELDGAEGVPGFLERHAKDPGVAAVVFGASLILVVLVAPSGIAGLPRRIGGLLTGRRYTRSS